MSFEFDFTPAKLAACINNRNVSVWYDTIVKVLPQYGITTKNRVAGWLAQTGHESGDYTTLQESLNYRTDRLVPVYGSSRISQTAANAYGRVEVNGKVTRTANQQAIANTVYGGAWGLKNLGNTTDGDGWKFRGRGLIQITGRSNYTSCSTTMYGNDILLTNPDLLLQIDGAVRSACWFWNSRNINAVADTKDILTMSKKVNGGVNGLDDRIRRFNLALKAL